MLTIVFMLKASGMLVPLTFQCCLLELREGRIFCQKMSSTKESEEGSCWQESIFKAETEWWSNHWWKKIIKNDGSSTYNQNKWGIPKSGNSINLYGQKLMHWCGKKDHGFPLPIPQAFTMLTRKTPLLFPYFTLIPTWKVFIGQTKHNLINCKHCQFNWN